MPGRQAAPATTTTPTETTAAETGQGPMSKRERFSTPQNLLGVLFLAIFAFNLMVMALDFPRFELVGVILLDPLRALLRALARCVLRSRSDEAHRRSLRVDLRAREYAGFTSCTS